MSVLPQPGLRQQGCVTYGVLFMTELPMRTDFAFVGVMLVTAFALMGVTLYAASLLRPKKPNKEKLSTYECGMETVGDAWVQFRSQYYIFALVFVLFDVEVILLFPIAVAFGQLSLFATINAIIFVIILFGAVLFAWRKGVLKWE
jgi:NADH:ubiquinone oxidoreductase subunit 3 (subunit A)